MTRSNVAFGCTIGAALFFFAYTFSGRGDEALQTYQPFRHNAPRNLSKPLASEALIVPVPATEPSADTVIPSGNVTRQYAKEQKAQPQPAYGKQEYPSTRQPDANMLAFFKEQAPQRKHWFKAALNKTEPTVVDVFLPLAEEVYCPTLVRVGSVADGGKWMCNPWAMPKGSVVFSLGSRNDISFETALQRATNRVAKIITVDMKDANETTKAGLEQIGAKFVWAKIAETSDLKATPPHYTVADLMKTMGHDKIEILKMDIEGPETSVLPQFLKGNDVCQILVEIHQAAETPRLLRKVADAGFLLQRYEVNPWGITAGVAEYSFIHERCLAKYGATRLASYLQQN